MKGKRTTWRRRGMYSRKERKYDRSKQSTSGACISSVRASDLRRIKRERKKNPKKADRMRWDSNTDTKKRTGEREREGRDRP
jgi:hypothetical protein